MTSAMSSNDPIRVLVTGAASPVGHTLCAWILGGNVFGARCIILHLLDIPEKAGALEKGALELQDCAFSLLKSVLPTCDPVIACQDISAAFLLDGMEMTSDITTREFMYHNSRIFRDQARCIDAFARKDCKVLVMATFSHTMTFICTQFAPSIPKENFSALARYDHNCAVGHLAEKMDLPANYIKNVCVWGNHSPTTFADAFHAAVLQNSQYKKLSEVLNDDQYLRTQFIEAVAHRNKTNKVPNAISMAKAAADQMHDWWLGTITGQFVSMAVLSDGCYGVPKDIIFSFPVEVQKGRWIIVKGFKLDEFSKSKIDDAVRELVMEKSDVITELEKE